jgi:hypothetical protein
MVVDYAYANSPYLKSVQLTLERYNTGTNPSRQYCMGPNVIGEHAFDNCANLLDVGDGYSENS